MEEEKEDNYSHPLPSAGFHYPYFDDHHPQQPSSIGMQHVDEPSTSDNNGVVNYMMNINLSQHQPQQQHSHHISPGFCSDASLDRLSFADVMQFADFGPKLAPNIHHPAEEEHFLKFPVLNDKLEGGPKALMMVHEEDEEEDNDDRARVMGSGGTDGDMRAAAAEDDEGWGSETTPPLVHLRFVGENLSAAKSSPNTTAAEVMTKNKRKRPRSIKTSEEVESQRMTHIAVERNRRKQMNEHLRVLRSLMPGSYVQRGDQASIIGGAIEFVRELEQLLQCLESQKRRRLLGSGGSGGDASLAIQQPQPPPFFPALPLTCEEAMTGQLEAAGGGCSGGVGLREDAAESKSCVADVEVKVVGFDAMIKVLSRRRPGQLIKAIAALEDLQLNILHTNITTIEQTVLYSFNVKVAGESRFTAEDIASSVQQIFTFIHTNSAAI